MTLSATQRYEEVKQLVIRQVGSARVVEANMHYEDRFTVWSTLSKKHFVLRFTSLEVTHGEALDTCMQSLAVHIGVTTGRGVLVGPW